MDSQERAAHPLVTAVAHGADGSTLSSAADGLAAAVDVRSVQRLPSSARAAVKQLTMPRPLRSCCSYGACYGAIIAAGWCAEVSGSLVAYVVAVVFIAARQHSLYILNHDAAHGTLFRSKVVNKWVATALSNLLFFHHPEAWSFVQWRRVHLLHHGRLFTDGDPNYSYRQKQGDASRPLSVARLLWRCLLTGVLSVAFWVRGKQDYVEPRQRTVRQISHLRALVGSFRGDAEMQVEQRTKLAAMVLMTLATTWLEGWHAVALYWFVPLYTAYPAILHFMDLTEHRWEAQSDSLTESTRSRRLGVIERIFITELPRTLHREHHVLAQVPVHELPALSALLVAHRVVPEPDHGALALFRELTDRVRRTALLTARRPPASSPSRPVRPGGDPVR